jgi:hypothetical protein
MENVRVLEYFIRSCNVWFPDFEEKIECKEQHYQKRSFHAMLVLLRYFRSEITREAFLFQFFAQDPPEKLLSIDKTPYLQIKEFCAAYQNKEISAAEFDEKVLISFRARPLDGVFSPPFELWSDVVCLISRLERKQKCLPIWFDFLGWTGYLKGNVTIQQYLEIAGDSGDYLCQLLDYGTDAVKEELNKTYSKEVAAALHLRKLCIDYKDELLSQEAFDNRFLQLAKDFCWDILE